MGFFIFAICISLVTLGTFLTAMFMYLKLIRAVKNNEEVPKWMYRIGHILKSRGSDPYKDITDKDALREVNIFFIGLIISNILVFTVMLQKGYTFPETVYQCLKGEFWIVMVWEIVFMLCNVGIFLISMVRKSTRKFQAYSPTKAITGMIFMTSFFLMISVLMSGVPARPVKIQIKGYNMTIGKTKASELLKHGFEFDFKNPEDIIVNLKNNPLNYGDPVELMYDGKSYGTVILTPERGRTAKLKDCIITYYGISGNNAQLEDIQINNRNISKLTWNDFKNNKIISIFSLNPADYSEVKGTHYFYLQIQTHPYMLWKRYTIWGNFKENGTLYQYEVRAHHEIWE